MVDVGGVVGASIQSANMIAQLVTSNVARSRADRAQFRAEQQGASADLAARAQQASMVNVDIGIPWEGIAVGGAVGLTAIGFMLLLMRRRGG